MELIPNYRVKYDGKYHEANIPFAIDPKDMEELSSHGVIVMDPTPSTPKKRGGRPRGQSGKAKSTNGRGG